jgi:hypothetical protein
MGPKTPEATSQSNTHTFLFYEMNTELLIKFFVDEKDGIIMHNVFRSIKWKGSSQSIQREVLT